MKNFIRVCAGLAAMFLVPGILCMVMGTALGGSWREAMRYTSVGDENHGMHLLGWHDDGYNMGWYDDWEAPEAPEAPEPPEAPTAPAVPGTGNRQRLGSYRGLENQAPQGVTAAVKLDFEMGGIKDVEILTGEGFGLYTEGDVGTLTNHMDGSTWEIKVKSHNLVKGSVYIILPEGLRFEEIELEVGAGGITGSGLQAEKLEAKANAGGIDLSGVWARRMDLEAQAGGVSVSGEVTEKAELTAEAGSVYLLTVEPADYGYKIESSMGAVSIDGDTFNTLSSTIKNNTGAATLFDVECSVGSVEVEFE